MKTFKRTVRVIFGIIVFIPCVWCGCMFWFMGWLWEEDMLINPIKSAIEIVFTDNW